MENVSAGVALLSQIGATSAIREEFRQQGEVIRDIWQGLRVPIRGDTLLGVNVTTDNFTVDSNHQYVSGATMIAPSLDRMMGVSQLRLCNGSDWTRSLKYCGELFSTATKSPRLFPRNSVQFSNCSFGYFEFTFLDYLEPPQQPFPPPESPACQQLCEYIVVCSCHYACYYIILYVVVHSYRAHIFQSDLFDLSTDRCLTEDNQVAFTQEFTDKNWCDPLSYPCTLSIHTHLQPIGYVLVTLMVLCCADCAAAEIAMCSTTILMAETVSVLQKEWLNTGLYFGVESVGYVMVSSLQTLSSAHCLPLLINQKGRYGTAACTVLLPVSLNLQPEGVVRKVAMV